MANEAQLKIFKKGVGAWNQWRSRNLEVRPDLSGADLSGPAGRQIGDEGEATLRADFSRCSWMRVWQGLGNQRMEGEEEKDAGLSDHEEKVLSF